jgi:hypothetical protein
METLSGSEFNKLHRDKKFVKLTNKKEDHNGFRYKTGLNENYIEFNPIVGCNTVGISFYKREEMVNWLSSTQTDYQVMVYYRDVLVPDYSKVYVDNLEGRYWADKVILSERKRVDESVFVKALQELKISLEHIENQTEEICLAAVKRNGLELKHVKNQTEEICLAAVKNCGGLALKYVEDKTIEICLLAVRQDRLSLDGRVSKKTLMERNFEPKYAEGNLVEGIRSAAIRYSSNRGDNRDSRGDNRDSNCLHENMDDGEMGWLIV